jgi:hypothetical protein
VAGAQDVELGVLATLIKAVDPVAEAKPGT